MEKSISSDTSAYYFSHNNPIQISDGYISNALDPVMCYCSYCILGTFSGNFMTHAETLAFTTLRSGWKRKSAVFNWVVGMLNSLWAASLPHFSCMADFWATLWWLNMLSTSFPFFFFFFCILACRTCLIGSVEQRSAEVSWSPDTFDHNPSSDPCVHLFSVHILRLQ